MHAVHEKLYIIYASIFFKYVQETFILIISIGAESKWH